MLLLRVGCYSAPLLHSCLFLIHTGAMKEAVWQGMDQGSGQGC